MISFDIVEKVQEMVGLATSLPVYIGSNPPMEAVGIDCDATTTFTGMDMDRGYEMRTAINGKSGDQSLIASELDKIHASLTLRKAYPSGDDWQIYAIETDSAPRLLGRESADRTQWLYGSSVRVKYYRKGIKG